MGDNADEAAPQTEETPAPEQTQGEPENTEPPPAEAPPPSEAAQTSQLASPEPHPSERADQQPQPAEIVAQEPSPSESAPQQPETKAPVQEPQILESVTQGKDQPVEEKPEDERKPEPTGPSKEPGKRESTTKGQTKETKASKGSLIEVSSGSLDRKGRGSITKEEVTRKSRSERLSSKAKNILGSTISIRRLSTTGEFFDRTKGARYMNSYKLDSENPFNPEKVGKILESVMIEALENLTYDPDKCPKQAKWASSAIRAKVKELQFDRYKLICLVTIGEKNSQDVLVTCRFLWDVDRDRYATYCMENTYVFGIAQCFGVYYE